MDEEQDIKPVAKKKRPLWYGWCMDGICDKCPGQNFNNKPCEHDCHTGEESQ